VVEEHSNQVFTADNFFEIAKAYPFGMSKIGGEMIVRDPMFLGENQSMICAGEVPKGCFVEILHGDIESLVSAAKSAKTTAKESFQPTENTVMILIDCISRVLVMGDQFQEELAAVREDGTPLFGALTIGEIANNSDTCLEFHNKTAVVGFFERPL